MAALPLDILQGNANYEQLEWCRTNEPCFLLACNKQTGTPVVVKCFPCGLLPREKEQLYRNVTVQWRATHPCVTRLFDFFDTPSHLCLVMEYLEGGSLRDVVEHNRSEPDNLTAVLDFVNDRGEAARRVIYSRGLTEATAKKYFCDVVHGLKAVHNTNGVHRQVTAENVLVTGDEQHAKLNNFLSSRVGAVANSRIALSHYTAPEVWQLYANQKPEYNSKEIDVWGLGVLLFYMLIGQYPFAVSEDLGQWEATFAMAELVTTTRLRIDPQTEISGECRELIERMLEPDPKQRITLEEIRQKQWCNVPDPQPNGPDNLDFRPDDDVIWQLIQNAGNIQNM